MKRNSLWQQTLGRCVVVLALGTMVAAVSNQAMAGCGPFGPADAPPGGWGVPLAGALMPAVYRPGSEQFIRVGDDNGMRTAGIVGLWKFTLVSDGTAYPAPIPFGAVVDFGTQQWHSDGTELIVSGGRPPSSGDVCMGVWEQTGNRTYKLKHVALSYIGSDTPPPLGPVSPAVFVGPAIIKEVVTLSRSGNSFEGTFTLDQYAKDETTLLQHIAGKVSGTRVTVD